MDKFFVSNTIKKPSLETIPEKGPFEIRFFFPHYGQEEVSFIENETENFNGDLDQGSNGLRKMGTMGNLFESFDMEPSDETPEDNFEQFEEESLEENSTLQKMETTADLFKSSEDNLSEETPIRRQIQERVILLIINRLLKAEKLNILSSTRTSKFLTLLSTTINPRIKKSAVRFITKDIGCRLDLALDWLHKEYSLFREIPYDLVLENHHKKEKGISYRSLFCILSRAIQKLQEEDRDALMSRLYLEAPIVPEEAMKLWNIIPDERGVVELTLLKNIIMEKPTELGKFIKVLLQYSKHEVSVVRKGSVNLVMDLYENSTFKKAIEDFALLHIEYLRLRSPPSELFGTNQGREQFDTQWTESTVRACLAMFIGVMEKNPSLILELERIFACVNPIIQKMILKYIRIPLRKYQIVTPLVNL